MMPAIESGQPVIFGDRYWLLRPLAVGGMAEIFLARQESEDGFSKNLVIKRLKRELAKDTRVVEMFHDEARISALLSHGNTVHVFDSGVHEGLPYIAMDYIRGQELNLLCRRSLRCGEFLPLEHAVELVRQAALGMGYYHNLRDPEGKALELVHCDISPNNLIVGQDGYLQIIDFGIGQYRGQRYRDAKLVPGKLSYMSPEQAARGRLDHRSDIFSLAVVLYEITLGKRLFRGPASEVLPLITSCEITAPTFVRHDYPGALESIVMRALEGAPSDRYQEAYDFADALGEYLREQRMRTGPVHIARYLDRLTLAEGGAPREELISEREADADDEALNFERDLFSGFRAMVSQDPLAIESWDEVEEDESAVADALGIDVELVRTASRATSESEGGRIALASGASVPEVAADDEGDLNESAASDAGGKHSKHGRGEALPATKSLWLPLVTLLVGLGLGIAGAVLAGAL